MPVAHLKNGQEIYFEQRGQGPDLLIIGGLGCDALLIEPLVKALEKDFSITYFDNRCVGRSASSDIVTMDAFTEDTRLLLEHLNLKQAIFCGFSMGSQIAANFAAKHPEFVKRLILVNTFNTVGKPIEVAFHGIVAMLEDQIDKAVVLDAFSLMLFCPDEYEKPSGMRIWKKILLEHPYPQKVEDFKKQANALLEFSIDQVAAQIHVDTVIISSCEDVFSPIEESVNVHRMIDGSRLQSVHAGHALYLENTPLCAQLIREATDAEF